MYSQTLVEFTKDQRVSPPARRGSKHPCHYCTQDMISDTPAVIVSQGFYSVSCFLIFTKASWKKKGSCCPLFHEKHHCLHNLSLCKLRPYTGHFLHFFVYVGFISLNKFLSAKSFQRARWHFTNPRSSP